MNKRQYGMGAVFTKAFREREDRVAAETNRKLCHEVLCQLSAAITMVMLADRLSVLYMRSDWRGGLPVSASDLLNGLGVPR